MMKRTIFSLSLLLAVFSSVAVLANPIGMMTGTKSGTYYAVGKDISAVATKAGAPLLLRSSKGSIENLQTMSNREENAALGIVQADILAFLKRSDKKASKEIVRNLRMIMPLFKEEVHILARKEITSLADLNGKRVVVGSSGSGSMMTSVNLFSMLEVEPAHMYQEKAPEAIVAVVAGRADAMLFVGGKPVPMFKNLEKVKTVKTDEMRGLLDKVHFLPIEIDGKSKAAMAQQYEKAVLNPSDYGFVQEPVETIAVRSVLVTFDFKQKNTAYYRQRCKQLGNLGKALYKELPALQKSGHKKWQEVDANRDLSLWKRDACAWPALQAASSQKPITVSKSSSNSMGVSAVSPLEEELLGIITQQGK